MPKKNIRFRSKKRILVNIEYSRTLMISMMMMMVMTKTVETDKKERRKKRKLQSVSLYRGAFISLVIEASKYQKKINWSFENRRRNHKVLNVRVHLCIRISINQTTGQMHTEKIIASNGFNLCSAPIVQTRYHIIFILFRIYSYRGRHAAGFILLYTTHYTLY